MGSGVLVGVCVVIVCVMVVGEMIVIIVSYREKVDFNFRNCMSKCVVKCGKKFCKSVVFDRIFIWLKV